MKRITITDVAKKAGVSISTASKALSNDDSISEKTTERVKKAANDIKYMPNRAARFLSRKKSALVF